MAIDLVIKSHPMTSIYLQATKGIKTPRPPIWMMRQAGRYLPEYRKIRDQYGFLEMIKTPELASEISLQPIRRFGFDAAILFSDILVVAQGLGMTLRFQEGRGPIFDFPVKTMKDIDSLSCDGLCDRVSYVFKTIETLRPALDRLTTPLIGFSGGPFTVAAYMIQGSGHETLKPLKTAMGQDPKLVHAVLKKVAQATIDYLNAQIRAGIDALQIFDTWAGLLSWQDFDEFVMPYLSQVLSELENPKEIPVTLFCKNSSIFAPFLTTLPIQVISLDPHAKLSKIRKTIPSSIALQGNLDPMALYASKETLRDHVSSILNDMAGQPGYIFNLGHGIFPDTQPEAVRQVVDQVKKFSCSQKPF